MEEANKAILNYGFCTLGLHRIQATVIPENERSNKLINKLGFVKEGLLRKYDYGKVFQDVYIYSILKDEYLSNMS